MKNLRSLEPQAKISHYYKKKSVNKYNVIDQIDNWKLLKANVISFCKIFNTQCLS